MDMIFHPVSHNFAFNEGINCGKCGLCWHSAKDEVIEEPRANWCQLPIEMAVCFGCCTPNMPSGFVSFTAM